MKIIIG